VGLLTGHEVRLVNDELLTLYQVAEELGCSLSSVKRRVKAGKLPVFVDDRLVRVRRVDLQRYVADRVSRATPTKPRVNGKKLPHGSRLWE
jgi:excisionase family DNA binding protein